MRRSSSSKMIWSSLSHRESSFSATQARSTSPKLAQPHALKLNPASGQGSRAIRAAQTSLILHPLGPDALWWSWHYRRPMLLSVTSLMAPLPTLGFMPLRSSVGRFYSRSPALISVFTIVIAICHVQLASLETRTLHYSFGFRSFLLLRVESL